MTHAEIQPDADCPGYLRPDRYRHRPWQPTRGWRCDTCGEHFKRSEITGEIRAMRAVPRNHEEKRDD